MKTLSSRIEYFEYIFELLQDTSSRCEKELIVADILPECKEDFDYIVECLAGKHKFGYKYYKTIPNLATPLNNFTIKKALIFLQTPMLNHDLSQSNIEIYVSMTNAWYDFFEPIVNRTLRLGIGGSLIDKTSLSPMLAKKFEGYASYDKGGYYITEKLDGNRCIAHCENGKWIFTSRNGKTMNVDFDMQGFDEKLIYDGEILSPEQVKMSIAIEDKVKYGIEPRTIFSDEFSNTSGLINRLGTQKKLIYNVFDIAYDAKYEDRRNELDRINTYSNNVRVVPILKHFETQQELQEVWDLLNKVTDIGGEGVMINLAQSSYLHKRTDQLLKLKKVYTMDLIVDAIQYGTGKYEAMVGSLDASIETDDGKRILCSVGTGLSDEQRAKWAQSPSDIIGKTIEVSYFSLSQTKENKEIDSNVYSLRFPRLKRIRYDKTITSEY